MVQIVPAMEVGGVERGTLDVANGLVQRGHRSIVISAGGRLTPFLARAGSEHVQWPIGAKTPLSLRWVGRLRRLLRERHVDILHVRSRLPAWIGYLAWRGMKVDQRPGFVTTVHGYYSVNPYSKIMCRGERVIAASAGIKEYIQERYPKVPEERIRLIPRGVNPSHFPWDYRAPEQWMMNWYRQYPTLEQNYVVSLPARLSRWKGQEEFIRIVAELKNRGIPVHGLLIGGAHAKKRAYEQKLRRQVAAAGLTEDISFVGHRDDVREIMSISDVVLSLSTDPEAFGRTTLEALSLGRPVAGYDHGGVGEQLQAVLPAGQVPVGDWQGMVQLLIGWSKSPPEVPRHHPFTLGVMLDSTLEVYKELTAGGRGPGTGENLI
ncbi:MAG: glycosyltransferase family 4 protein [Gammaproteobacteria bacterium]